VIFIKGLALGFSIAAPVGPIGVLCIRRAMALGFSHAFATGLGAATADAIYGAVAAFGLTLVSDFLLRFQNPLQILGGLFLGMISVGILKARAKIEKSDSASSSLLQSYFSTIALTLSNPATILSFVAAFSAFRFIGASTDPWLLVLGVFAGSAVWWLSLSYVSSRLKSRLGEKGLRWVNTISGSVLLAFSSLAIIAGVAAYF
jgi:threonine/homoserine/homoserine lactone efflux protein